MIAFFNVMLDVVFLSVVALAITLGGRYERYAALVQVSAWIAVECAQRLSHGLGLPPIILIDIGVLVFHLWLLWRVRPLWLVWSAAIQVVGLGLEAAMNLDLLPSVWVYLHGAAVLAYAQQACLGYAVLRRCLGPPFALIASSALASTRRSAAASV